MTFHEFRGAADAASFATLSRTIAPLGLTDRLRALRETVDGRLVFTTSFGLEDQAVTHAIAASGIEADIVTLDTGRLFDETLELWAETEIRYGRSIRAVAAATEELEALVSRDGPLGFRRSIEARKACCDVRKVRPLKRVLAGAAGWLTGLRGDQSAARATTPFVEIDPSFGVLKFNPLADWGRDRIADYVLAEGIPYNALHDRGFPSIGCAPCTRAVRVGEPERAGRWWWENEDKKECGLHGRVPPPYLSPSQPPEAIMAFSDIGSRPRAPQLSHLQRLEAESIHIMREVVAEARNPVMLYSIGKDSSVLLHLALKAFYPGKLPFPLLHVDTGWKFREMIAFRDRRAAELGLDLIVHQNPDGVARGIGPISHGSEVHTDVMKTQGLRQALDAGRFDAAFGGARRDEEASRAKERIVSMRSPQHRWDPKLQRPEPWRLYNALKPAGHLVRVFPLSNWTERDVWLYIEQEGIPLVPLYFAADRPVVKRDGQLLMVDDERLPLFPGEQPELKRVRFRTLGCYPLTGAIESDAATLPDVITETLAARVSERSGRAIDQDGSGSMERKKQEGYF